MDTTYPAPLYRLLTLGGDVSPEDAWLDYPALGIGPEHVPALVAIASGEPFGGSPELEAWAPLHAWRALGQLGAVEAIPALIALACDWNDGDWLLGDLPEVLALMGPAAIPGLVTSLGDPSNDIWARVSASDALGRIGGAHPEARGRCVTAIANQLARYLIQDSTLNACLVGHLCDLKAVEEALLIQEAYAEDRVDCWVEGDWEDVQVRLGLLEARASPALDRFAMILDAANPWHSTDPPSPGHGDPQAAAHRKDDRARRKRQQRMSRESKRRNRKRR